MNKPTSLLVAIVGLFAVSSAFAAGPATTGAKPATAGKAVSASLSPKQRGAAIRQFVIKWGPYVEHVYAVDVRTWSKQMVGQFALGDPTNIRRALQRDTFEGAMAELDGVGHRLSDDRVITKLASMSAANPTPKALGDIDKDLVFTPVVPCRLMDTRIAGGQVLAGTTREFPVWGYANFTPWGGSSTDCGMQSQHPTTAVINITAVFPASGGFATAFAGNIPDGSRPLASSLNYVAGTVVNNSVMVNISPSGFPDWKLYSGADSHYVADIVGFYDNPLATPLQTVVVESSAAIPANSDSGIFSPTCPVGYSLTGGGCAAGQSSDLIIVTRPLGTQWHCHVRAGAIPSFKYAYGLCARVPGR